MHFSYKNKLPESKAQQFAHNEYVLTSSSRGCRENDRNNLHFYSSFVYSPSKSISQRGKYPGFKKAVRGGPR